MSAHNDQRKRIRVLAFSASRVPSLKTVNVTTVSPSDKHRTAEWVQDTRGVNDPTMPTVMDSGGTVAGLKTVFISGYSGPA